MLSSIVRAHFHRYFNNNLLITLRYICCSNFISSNWRPLLRYCASKINSPFRAIAVQPSAMFHFISHPTRPLSLTSSTKNMAQDNQKHRNERGESDWYCFFDRAATFLLQISNIRLISKHTLQRERLKVTVNIKEEQPRYYSLTLRATVELIVQNQGETFLEIIFLLQYFSILTSSLCTIVTRSNMCKQSEWHD